MRSANSYNRIVIKIGSAVLANSNGIVRHNILSSISEDIAWLLKNDKEVLIVSSGAIALGRKKIKLSEMLTVAESQALAAHGQIELMSAWKKHLNKFSIPIGQILLTPKDTELKLSSKNAKQTVAKLLEAGCLPIINENDSTATDEIRFGDNDLLAANILDDGDQLWLIDWEYGGFNTPLFDLAGLAGNNGLSVLQEKQMLEQYFEQDWQKFWRPYNAMKCTSLMRETLWSMVSELYSEIEFDYAAYTVENLNRLNAAISDFKNT